MDERSRRHDPDVPGAIQGARERDHGNSRGAERPEVPDGGYAHPSGGYEWTPGRGARDERASATPREQERDVNGEPGDGPYGRHGGDSTGYAGYGGTSEHRYGEDDRRREGRRENDAGMRSRAAREREREAWREGMGDGPRPSGRSGGPYRGGWGRDDDYRSSGQAQGPAGSGATHSSGYGQQPTHARGGYGEGSGFTDPGHRRGYATGFGPWPGGPLEREPGGPRWSREDTHGERERRDESASGAWDADAARPPQPARRGPKAYRRSDERIKEDIYERLIDAWEIDSSDVTVEVHQGKVTLQGSVPERRMKHRVEDLVDACHGVEDIDNFIRVRRAEDAWGGVSPRGHQASRAATAAAAQTPTTETATQGGRAQRGAGDEAGTAPGTSGDLTLGKSDAGAPDGSAGGSPTGDPRGR